MKQRAMVLMALWAALLMGASGCRSTESGTTWREATALVLGEGTAAARTVEGPALEQYLRTFVPDERTGFRLVHKTQTGYMVIGGKRYLVTAAVEQVDGGRDLLTIHAGSEPLHLKQREP